MSRIPFRQRIFVVVAAAVVPLAVMSGIALFAGYQQQRAQAERSGLDVARALSIAIDSELRRIISVLQVLDDALEIGREDLPGFHQHIQRVVASHPHWRTIVLFDASGTPLVSSDHPYGVRPPALVERESFDQVVATRAPVVGYLAKGPQGRWAFPVRVPVLRDGQVRYVVTAILDPDVILGVIQGQKVPEGWVVAVADARGLRVARTRSSDQSLGTPFSPTLVEMMRKSGDEGKGITYSSEGDSVFTAYTRSRETGWYTAVGLPTMLVEAAARHSFNTWGGGLVLSLVVGIGLALLLARRVTEPMQKLRDSAIASTHGAAFEPAPSEIREIDDVSRALSEASQRRAELLQAAQEARSAAENANRAKDEFLAMLGHELRNPLGAISNATALLDTDRLTPEQAARARGVISRQVGHLSRLTDDLLDVGRALTGKIDLRRQPMDLAALVAQSVATLKTAQRLREHRVVEEYQSAWADCDPIRIDQIVTNLVVNAVKYTPAGGTIRVSVRREGNQALLRVADNGIGLAPELAPRVFDLFVQGERALDRSQGGLGIGLTLVRRLAEMHGGGASVHSAGVGQGTELTVRLPAIEPRPHHDAEAMRMAGETSRHILVVEDNDDAAETLKTLLEMHGHRVDVASDGLSGLERWRTLQPEVVLLDVGLPHMDGYDVARRIRASDGIRHPLLVAVTGYGAPEDRQRAFEAGFDAHITKPVDYASLASLLSGLNAGRVDSKQPQGRVSSP